MLLNKSPAAGTHGTASATYPVPWVWWGPGFPEKLILGHRGFLRELFSFGTLFSLSLLLRIASQSVSNTKTNTLQWGNSHTQNHQPANRRNPPKLTGDITLTPSYSITQVATLLRSFISRKYFIALQELSVSDDIIQFSYILPPFSRSTAGKDKKWKHIAFLRAFLQAQMPI